jgi:LmbE family N-acetylglucosaminyl deacetylase
MHYNARVHWVIFSTDRQRKQEALTSAKEFLRGTKWKKIIIKNFRNSYFPYYGKEIKDFFEKLKTECSPDIVFTHYRNDLHQDHRLISELTWNTFRNHFILEYEVPKYDGDFGNPNFFVHLDESTCRRKVESILKYYNTQREKHWFTEDTFYSMLRLRGMESNSQSKFAEGFYCRKIVL